jgi:type III restriction enzyme
MKRINNSEWALIFNNEKKIYFLAETKHRPGVKKLRDKKMLKIKCVASHFEDFEDVEYKHVTKVTDLI